MPGPQCVNIKVLLEKWKTLHLESFLTSYSLRLSLVQRFLLYILYSLSSNVSHKLKIAPVHIWQTSRPHSHAYYSVIKTLSEQYIELSAVFAVELSS
jgi:hypothetical protein